MVLATTDDAATNELLERFIDGVRPLVPLVSVWVHGSIAAGTDYRPGRSDLDLIAVVERPCTDAEEKELASLHEGLERASPIAAVAEKLHCSYVALQELDEPERDHLTWAMRELFRRPVSPVTRVELHRFGRVLYGRPVAGLLPEVTDGQLKEYIVRNTREYVLPVLDKEDLFRADEWVDYGMLALARALVTLRDGTLITKAEAFGVLARLGAPAEVVADIRKRRYGGGAGPGPGSEAEPAATALSSSPPSSSPEWLDRRAQLTLAFLRPQAQWIVDAYDEG
ncbi:nucleotidyltransferase domain-containing protein [Streptomyces sp. NPDC047315]|uniref:nucleotidyltransferase domain-containing protein n=1 Tax=Streptomyces sp. NPDC047315 TaxID=3155142 RepID=UPI0033D97ABD